MDIVLMLFMCLFFLGILYSFRDFFRRKEGAFGSSENEEGDNK